MLKESEIGNIRGFLYETFRSNHNGINRILCVRLDEIKHDLTIYDPILDTQLSFKIDKDEKNILITTLKCFNEKTKND